ncbi:LysE/ArgO family amino acid transporter [Peredibacter starrii]|uniref:LysE family transporter n=1 Tax=Peredibacter starrii TaxID=28202 RepID=A0AAX4HVI4_9BACT|nr:LysE family transporter [Peredibacter starrii]WPU66975.1 LysE family transporter [Peredibacter starrii]
MKEVFLEGLLLQASLIFALGPQNLFVLESGLRRHHHITVSFVCFLCDLSLIMLGVAGAATFFNHYPQIKIFFGVVGVGFLLLYGFGKITTPEESFVVGAAKAPGTLKSVILKSITFSVINPHAYLDGIVLIGGYSAKYSDIYLRLTLGMGAATFSLIWFLLLSLGASVMMPFFQSPKRMRLMMGSAGLILLFLSAKLTLDVYGWLLETYPETASVLHFGPR